MGRFSVIVAKATTNECENPSFETNTTSWITLGTNTIARSTTESFYGSYSLLCTYQNNTRLASDALQLTASTAYTAQARVWVQSTWNGGNLRLVPQDYAGVSTTYDTIWTAASGYGQWVYLQTRFTLGADAVGSIELQTTSAPTGGRYCYLDAVQVEEGDQPTTYCDGDQVGCEWTGTRHGSTSNRSVMSGAGGSVVDLTEQYGFTVGSVLGTGVPPHHHNVHDLALLSGGIYQSTKIQPPVVTLTGMISGAEWANVQADRKLLVEAFAPSGVRETQPVVIRYTGGTTDKEVAGYYEGGLEYDGSGQRAEQNVAIRMRALDPYWYSVDELSVPLDVWDLVTTLYIIGKVDGEWSMMGPPAGVAAGVLTVRAIAIGTDKYVYVGGNFTNWDNVATQDYITFWDGSSWNNAAYGADALINVLVVGPNGNLYAGGNNCDFGNGGAGDLTCRGIGRWDGTNWNALGPPSAGGNVNAIAFDSLGEVYIGGNFTNWDGVAAADYVATWDGAAWAAVSAGGSGTVEALVFDADDNLYIGGDFTDWNSIAAADYVVMWNGTAYAAMDTGLDGAVYAMAKSPDGRIFAGGAFTDGISAWNGSAWNTVGGGVTGTVTDLAFAPDGTLFVSGTITYAGDLALATRIARWNGHSWAPVGCILPGAPDVRAIAISAADPVVNSNYDVYFGYDTTGTTTIEGTVSVTNTGSAVLLPIVEFTRSGGTTATIQTLRNETNGRELLFNYGLLDGETLTLDLRRGKQDIRSSFWGRKAGAILRGSDFSNFVLEPGANTLSCLVRGVGPPTMTVSVRARRAFKGFDD